jgi:hypothetical protein
MRPAVGFKTLKCGGIASTTSASSRNDPNRIARSAVLPLARNVDFSQRESVRRHPPRRCRYQRVARQQRRRWSRRRDRPRGFSGCVCRWLRRVFERHRPTHGDRRARHAHPTGRIQAFRSPRQRPQAFKAPCPRACLYDGPSSQAQPPCWSGGAPAARDPRASILPRLSG